MERGILKKMTKQIIKLLAGIALMGYLSLSLFGLFTFSSHMHQEMPMNNCPYAMGTHSLCSMDAFGHIQAWEKLMLVTIPMLLLFVALATVVFVWPKILESSPPVSLRRRPERQYSPYALLFSRGILNPKIP